MLRCGGGRRSFGGRALVISSGGGFDPLDYSPSQFLNFTDITTLSQVYNSDVPVTAVDEPIGHVDDLSGGGYYVAQEVSAARPLLKQDGNGFYYVATDGIDDTLVGNINLGGSQKATVFVAYRTLGTAGVANGVYLAGTSDTDTGAMELYQYNPGALHYSSVKGTTQLQGGVTVPSAASIVTQVFDISSGTVDADTIKVWVNGSAQSPSYLGGPAGSAILLNDQTYSLTLGAMSFGNYKGAFGYYAFIVYDRILTTPEREAVEAWINERCGAF